MMKQHSRIKLTLKQRLTHYMIVIYLLFIPITISSFSIYDLLTNSDQKRISDDDLWIIIIVSVSLAILFYLLQYHRLRYKKITLHFTEDQFQEAIRRTGSELNWKIQKNSHSLFRALVPINGFGNWYSMLSIEKHKDKILMNSICDPNNRANAFSYRANRRIVSTFLSHLNESVLNLPEKRGVKDECIKHEWGIKRTIIRIIAYPFCICLISIGLYELLNPINVRSIPSGIGTIIIAGTYLYIDLKIIIKNRELKK